MLSRGLASVGRQAVRAQHQPVRNMATAQQLRERISAVKNIKKITSAMKMVAVCKLRVAQENLEKSRVFARAVDGVDFKPADAEKKAKSKMWVGISSDRGLCGAINSSISRGIRDSIYAAEKEGVEEFKVVLIGEKCKQGLERLFKQHFKSTLSETAKFKPCTFKQCGMLTDYWLREDYESSSVFWQHFKSMISYETTETVFWSYNSVKDDVAAEFADYEMEGDADILQNFHEFRSCVMLYRFFAENETSTLSARMAAMDNSSNNADDVVNNLTLVLNRSRQAKITTELSEIISGAAAVDDA
jgi:F-type H+-transporting ATPase subunit gamma